MDFGFFFLHWFLSLGFILGVVGMAGLLGGVATVLAVLADHPALRPPSDGEEGQLELPFGERQPASSVLALV